MGSTVTANDEATGEDAQQLELLLLFTETWASVPSTQVVLVQKASSSPQTLGTHRMHTNTCRQNMFTYTVNL